MPPLLFLLLCDAPTLTTNLMAPSHDAPLACAT